MSGQSSFSKVKRALAQHYPFIRLFALCSVPVLSFLAYIASLDIALLGIAVLTPMALLISEFEAPKSKFDRDPKTGLSDETGFVASLDRQLKEDPAFHKTACIAISINRFEEIHRKWGNAAADFAVSETAQRMLSILRTGDQMARISKSSFCIMVCSIRPPETSALLTLCERLEDVTATPIQIDGGILNLTLSAGFCIDAKAPERTGASILLAAKAALQEAEQNAPHAIRSFSANTVVPVETDLSNEVLNALREGHIQPWFQPQISTDTGEITGFEALARWEHPVKGTLPPSAFVPALEAANRLEELGENILNHALRALVEWDKANAIVPTVAVNFATQELRNPSLVERIKWDVDRFDLTPSRLTVEILETVISEHDDDVITRNIRALGSQGFHIDLDDFGTGHASLSNIRRFAVDRIKIDRSFVVNADSDPEQQRMIAAIVGLGERLGIETLAEGVENIGEQSILSQLGCTHLQGFAVARPMPFDKTIGWILQHQKSLNTPSLLGKHAS